jgi:Family of unknown function (DUF6502)
MNDLSGGYIAVAPPRSLTIALQRLMRPLVRLLLANGITYPFLSGLMKAVYVDVAVKDFPLPGKSQTDSRISLLSGVHRKDVRRFRHDVVDNPGVPASAISLGAELLTKWTTHPDYIDATGNPVGLPRLSGKHNEKSFESLVESVSKDIRSRVVLDEWLRIGVARLDEQNNVCLNVDAFIPAKGFDEKAFYFGQNMHDHIAAGMKNLMSDPSPYFDRCVYHDMLTPSSVKALDDLVRELGMQALQSINRKALELKQQQDPADTTARFRMNFGLYFYNEYTETRADRDRRRSPRERAKIAEDSEEE